MNDADLVEIYRAKNAQQAALLKNLLEDEGIDAQLSNQGLEAGIGEAYGGWSFAPQVLVRRRDAEQARALADAWETRLTDNQELSELEDLIVSEPAHSWRPPLCALCQQPRHAICPNCETAGTDFDPAELLQADGSGGIMGRDDDAETTEEIDAKELRLMCTVCDQSFQPRYVRHCQKCGYDFGDGVEFSPHTTDMQINGRALFVIVALLVIGLAAAAYFLFIAN